MPAQLIPFLDDLPIPPVVKPFGNGPAEKQLTIKSKSRLVYLHQQLPPTSVWSYRLSEGTFVRFGSGSTYLGPTIVVNRGDLVRTNWENKILASKTGPGTLPYDLGCFTRIQLAGGYFP